MAIDVNMEKVITDEIKDALKEMGTANILIAGKTGVGKSTLVNAVFQGKIAKTGTGKPITQSIKRWSKKGIPLGIYDSKGLELQDYEQIIDELEDYVKDANRSTDPHEHIHAAWLCISEPLARFEDAEILLAKKLAKLMPVILVMTNAYTDKGEQLKKQAKKEFPTVQNIIRVNSEPMGPFPATGLDELVEVTMEVIPEGQKKAFAAAQKIKLELRADQAHKIVKAAAVTAAGIAAVPIPFADAVAIIPVQISMLAKISTAFGIDVDKTFLGTLVAGTFTAVAGSMGGRALVGSLLKLIPGVGSAAGAAVSAAVAGTITTVFGEAYIAVLQTMLKDSPEMKLSAEAVAKAFKSKLTSKK